MLDDLARHCGRQFRKFECSEVVDYTGVLQLVKGAAASGAWACLADIQRLRVDVQSVMAQHMWSVLQHISAKLEGAITIDGTELKLDPTAAIVATMRVSNSRTVGLPEHLRALFRPVTVASPDLRHLGEITLAAHGFRDAVPLARKLASAFALLRDLLTQQAHYDFSAASFISVVVSSRALRWHLGVRRASETGG